MEGFSRQFLEGDIKPSERDVFSFISYLGLLSGTNSTDHEITIASKIIYKLILEENDLFDGLKMLENCLSRNSMFLPICLIDSDNSKYYIRIHDTQFFGLVSLSSFMYVKKDQCRSRKDPRILLHIAGYIRRHLFVANDKSVFLLRALENILHLDKNMHPLYVIRDIRFISPIEPIKFHCNKLLKLVSKNTYRDLLKLEDVPMTLIKAKYVDIENIFDATVVSKILKLFENNIHNRDGGFLYSKLVEAHSFQYWKSNIWPLFLENVRNVQFSEGELLQSYVKYWIPINISQYKEHFADFVSGEDYLDIEFIGYVLLEARKHGYLKEELLNVHLTKTFVTNRSLGLKILCTYSKQTAYPRISELNFMRKYIYTFCDEQMDCDETKCIDRFFSQIFLISHSTCSKHKQAEEIFQYDQFIENIFDYCDFNLKYGNNFEFATQIIHSIVKIGIGDAKTLRLPYKIDKSTWYNSGENNYYKYLKNNKMWHFHNDNFVNNIFDKFEEHMQHSQNFTNLLDVYNTNEKFRDINCDKLKKLVKSMKDSPSLKNTQKVKNYTYILCRKLSDKGKHELLSYAINALEDNLNQENYTQNISNVFEHVLLMEIFGENINYTSEKYLKNIEKSFHQIEQILERQECDSNTNMKIIEAFINNILTCLEKNKHTLKNLDKLDVLQILEKIIRAGNMKRPVSLSIEVLKRLGSLMGANDSDKNMKILFVSELLNSLLHNSHQLNVKIRRCPESRLMLHAMCISEKSDNKIFLPWVVNFLLDVITNKEMEPSAISASLHSLEILISDHNLHIDILEYFLPMITSCVTIFKNPDWLVRNAALQLAKSIIERTLGVSLGYFHRQRCMNDLFSIIPTLESFFLDLFAEYNNLDDNVIMALQFFIESQTNCERPIVSSQSHLKQEHKCFSVFFDHIIRNYSTSYGRFAVFALAASIKEESIPDHFELMIDRMLCTKYVQNVFWNYIKYLKELYKRYLNSFEYRRDKNITIRLDNSFKCLLPKIRAMNPLFISLMSLNIYNFTDISYMLSINKANNFQRRILELNNIPYLFLSCKANKVSIFFEEVFKLNISCTTEIVLLEILIDRHNQKHFSDNCVKNILLVLSQRLVSLENKKYLFYCYFEVISLLFKGIRDIDIATVLPKIRENYNNILHNNNVHQILSLIIVLSNLSEKSQADKNFISYALSHIKKTNLESVELSECISYTLKYLLKCVSCSKCYCDIFTIAYVILLKHEIYDFSDHVTQSQSISALDALIKFLEGSNLRKHFSDENDVRHLVKKFYIIYLKHFRGGLAGSESFYVTNENCFVGQKLLEKLLSRALKNVQGLQGHSDK